MQCSGSAAAATIAGGARHTHEDSAFSSTLHFSLDQVGSFLTDSVHCGAGY